jgi:hypothetical protein
MFAKIAGLFGGPIGMIGSFFAGGLGKLIGILSLVAVIMGSVTAIYFSWSNAIQEATAAKYEKVRAEELVKNRESEIKILKGTNEAMVSELSKLKTDQTAINLQSESIQQWLSSQKGTPGDRESSDILKETFNRLYGKEK